MHELSHLYSSSNSPQPFSYTSDELFAFMFSVSKLKLRTDFNLCQQEAQSHGLVSPYRVQIKDSQETHFPLILYLFSLGTPSMVEEQTLCIVYQACQVVYR